MAITGPASYIPTMNEFTAHWALCNAALPPASPLLVRQLNNTTMTQVQFAALRDSLQTQQNTIQSCLAAQEIARGGINLKKTALLTQFALFTSLAAVPRTFINATTGWLVENMGWFSFFMLCSVLALPGMIRRFRIRLATEDRLQTNVAHPDSRIPGGLQADPGARALELESPTAIVDRESDVAHD